jgi:hypothetical protein
MKILLVGAELFYEERLTDRQTDRYDGTRGGEVFAIGK